jgi:predicted CXXCH cytochrome family protein
MKSRLWKSHVWRPLIVVVVLVIILVLVRQFIYVPKDFGVHDLGYTYGWYRQGDIQDWKDVTVKYQGRDYCKTCHQTEVGLLASSPHTIIQCENCHGPAVGHPADPPKLAIDTTRELCLRCHALLPYAASGRAVIKGIDPTSHNPGIECVQCHNPHKANLPGA